MVQDNKQTSDKGSQGAKRKDGSTPKQTNPDTPQKNNIDIASIDALASDASGEFIRGSKKEVPKKNIPSQKTPNKKTIAKKTAKKPVPDKTKTTQGEKKEEYTIPVLRTYQHDTKSVAQTKGGAELRTILAKEAEEKRKAQKEYVKNTKDIMKESAVLRDTYRNFKQGKQKQDTKTPAPGVQDDDRENVTRTLSGATAYMQSVQENTAEQEKTPPNTSKKQVPKKQTKPRIPIATPDDNLETLDIETLNEKPDPPAEKPNIQKDRKKGIFSRIRGRVLPKDAFTKEQREVLQQKQQESVEKESLQSAWKDFKQKKKKLKEMGMRARDVRSYNTPDKETAQNKPLQKQNMLLLAIVFFLLAGLVSSVIFLALTPTEEPVIENFETNVLPVSDVLNSEKQVSADVSDEITLPEVWQSITRKDGEQDTITKYVPYIISGEKELQISFKEFSRVFDLRFPPGLQNAFGNYYFIGKYQTETKANGIFIASIKRYGDAFVWMSNWEKNIINTLSSVFPGMFHQSNVSNVSVESRIIDNQDVRIIRNTRSQEKILYYFFGRSILVFIAGDESVIPVINARIRSANAL